MAQESDGASETSAASVRGARDTAIAPLQLRLDEVLAELIERATEARATRGRLRALLESVIEISGGTSLAGTLQQIVDEAAALVHARYAAVGVLSRDGEEFVDLVTHGIDDEDRKAIGEMPHAAGLLLALSADPRPIRVDDIAADPRSAGFPPHHPPMRNLLAVPLRTRDTLFGHLYLADRVDGQPFDDDDERLVVALTAAAGAAVESSQLFDARARRGRWLAATAAVATATLQDGPTHRLLDVIVEQTLAAAGALRAALVLPEPNGELRIAAVAGAAADRLRNLSVPVERSLAGDVLRSAAPAIWDLRQRQPVRGIEDTTAFGCVIAVPLASPGGGQPAGVLSAGFAESSVWHCDDVELMNSLAGQAAVGYQLSLTRGERDRTAVIEERDRIARDLHDHVIQRLFATGMTLQSTLQLLPPEGGPVAERLERVTDDLDQTVRDVRQVIYQLRSHGRPGLRHDVEDLVTEATEGSGLEVSVRIKGPLDSVPLGAASDNLLAVLRESLTNVVRHAHAGRVEIEIAVAEWLVVTVSDNGVGVAGDRDRHRHRRSGLANLLARAHDLGGGFEISSAQDGGTRLSWWIPMH